VLICTGKWNAAQADEKRREEEMVVNERREALESIYRYGGVVVGGRGR